MKYFFCFWSCCLLLFTALSIPARAQELNSFNLNFDNGLPDNHVYGTIVDRHGYLWMCTPKGVIKYNGYETRLFNLSDGLPNEDVWELMEDKQGRIWLSNIAAEYGYILNNKYHKPYRPDSNVTITPQHPQKWKNSIIFYCSSGEEISMITEKNDTFYRYPTKLFGTNNLPYFNTVHPNLISFNESGIPLLIYDNFFYKLVLDHDSLRFDKKIKIGDTSLEKKLARSLYFTVGNYIISTDLANKSNTFSYYDLTKNSSYKISLSKYKINETIHYICPSYSERKLYIITNSHIVEFSYKDSIKHICTIPISEVVSNTEGNHIFSIINDAFWNKCIGSTTNGLWINYNLKNKFTGKDKINLHNYQYVGGKSDSICFWWNSATNTLIRITKNFEFSSYKINGLSKLANITHYKNDTFLVNAFNAANYFLIDKTSKLIGLPNLTGFPGIVSTIIDSTQFFVIARFGFFKFTLLNDSSITKKTILNLDRFNGLTFDSTRKQYWAYNLDKVFIHGEKGDLTISNEKLLRFGVKKIEKVAIDNKYGNIFFKGFDQISVYNYEKNSYSALLRNFNLKGSSIYIYHNTLITIGRFGIVFCKIQGPQNLSPPLLYPNIKNINYNRIYDCQLAWGKILLSTDKGSYQVTIPSDSEIINSNPAELLSAYKTVFTYKDSVYDMKSGDTITMDQTNFQLQFDIINPYGNGHVKYSYRVSVDSEWHELNGNELNLSQILSPNKFSNIFIRAYDNVWRSDEIELHFYLKPYWWQTAKMKKIIWASSIFLFLLLLLVSVLLTRRYFLRLAKKKNLQREMELKSIYSQINPHFIFNSLNSALLLVSKNQMEDAYTHISKFSRLLRSYIKSSRNRLIAISDERNNLEDYIQLQQTRFKNKFNYQILVSDSIDSRRIMIPSLLIQPFVENAINHGILEKQETGNLTVEFTMFGKNNQLICTIEDDGIGRKQSKSVTGDRFIKDTSYGDLLIQDLVSIFNKYENMNIDIKYTDKEAPLTGTIVTIQIKNPRYAP